MEGMEDKRDEAVKASCNLSYTYYPLNFTHRWKNLVELGRIIEGVPGWKAHVETDLRLERARWRFVCR